METKTVYTETTINRKGTLTYPYLLIKESFDALSIIIGNTPEGTLPLVVNYKGKLIKIKDAAKELKTFNNFIRLKCPISVVLSETEEFSITTIEDILELEKFAWTDC